MVPLARDLCVKRFGKSIFTLMIYRTTGNIHKNIPKCGQWSPKHDPPMHAKRLQLSENVTSEGKLITGCYQWPDGNLTFLRENILAATVIVLNLIIPFQGVHGQSSVGWPVDWSKSDMFCGRKCFLDNLDVRSWKLQSLMKIMSNNDLKYSFWSNSHPSAIKFAAQGSTETGSPRKQNHSSAHKNLFLWHFYSIWDSERTSTKCRNNKKTISINICMRLDTVRGRFERICLKTLANRVLSFYCSR